MVAVEFDLRRVVDVHNLATFAEQHRSVIEFVEGGSEPVPSDRALGSRWRQRLAAGAADVVRATLRDPPLRDKPHGMLTRGVSGVRGRTLILSFPGSPNACREGFAVVRPVLDHALRLLREVPTAHL